MIPDSSNTAPRFIQLKPDWGEDYDFVTEFVTGITRTENASEQRSRRRQKARYSLAYQVSGITRAEFGRIRVEAMRGIGAPIAVPIWHAFQTVLAIAGDDLEMDTDKLLLRPFKVGGLIYLEEDGFDSVFIRIAALTADTITLPSPTTPEFPAIAIPAYVTPRVYPVIEGMTDENTIQFLSIDLNNFGQSFDVKEL